MNKEAKSSKLFTLRTGETVMRLESFQEYADLQSLGCEVGWTPYGDESDVKMYSLFGLQMGRPVSDNNIYYVLVDSDNNHNDD